MGNHRNEEWLREVYLRQGLGVPTIAKMVRRSKKTVRHHLKKFGIPMRSLKESRRLRWERELKAARERGEKQWQDAEWLREQYIERGFSSGAIAKAAGCTPRTVRDTLKKFGVPMRSCSEARRLMHRANRKWWQTAEWLEKQYFERHFSQVAIAKAVGCCLCTVRHWIKKFGIPKPPPRSGHTSPYPGEWTEELRESIRGRDGRACVLCGRQEAGRKLDVHHVDQDKQNCDFANLVSLCRPCHRAAHGLGPLSEERAGKVRLWHDEGWLREQYLERGCSQVVLAKMAGCSQQTIGMSLRYFAIPVRTFSEAGRLRWSKVKEVAT